MSTADDEAIARALAESDEALARDLDEEGRRSPPQINIPDNDEANDLAISRALQGLPSPHTPEAARYDERIFDLVASSPSANTERQSERWVDEGDQWYADTTNGRRSRDEREDSRGRSGGLFRSFFPRYLAVGRRFLGSMSQKEYGRGRDRLQELLQQYGLAELDIPGDGNCQFGSIADQLYRDPSLHTVIRQVVVDHMEANPEFYRQFLPAEESYAAYLADMRCEGHWGDHLTLQAAADAMGVQINLVTSESDSVVQVEPKAKTSDRVLWLSFVAEFHYNSLYPADEIEGEKERRAALPTSSGGKQACALQ